MVIGIAEIIEKISKYRTTQDKINAFKANDSLAMRIILQGCYDPNVVWNLPEGIPPYKPNELVDQEHILLKECAYIKYFIKGFHDNINQVKRETMFVQFLERLAPKDAELLCKVKEKKPLKGVTMQHVTEAFPGLIPNV